MARARLEIVTNKASCAAQLSKSAHELEAELFAAEEEANGNGPRAQNDRDLEEQNGV